MTADKCKEEEDASAPSDNCTSGVTFDTPTSIRVGGDYKSVTLPARASAADCAASCCADPHCDAFSFNNMSSSAPPVCKHKNAENKLQTHTCPCCAAAGIRRGACGPRMCEQHPIPRAAAPTPCAMAQRGAPG